MWGVLVLVLTVGLSACGSSSSSSSSSSASSATPSSTSANTEKANAVLAEATGAAKWEGPTERAPAAHGKHIVLVPTLAAAEGLQIFDEGAKQAAKAIGWNLTIVDGKGTPQGYGAAVEQAITEHADGVILGAVTPSLIANQMKQLKAAGIPVVAYSNTEQPKEALWIANIGYEPKKEGKYLAAFVAKESGGKAKILLVNDPEYGIVQARLEAFKPALTELCPECKVVTQAEMQVTELETKLGPKIGGLLQANPGVDHIYAPYDASVPVMITALKQAGLEKQVKVVSYGGFKQNTEYLRKKEIQTATIANATQWQAWEAFDTLNRHFDKLNIPSNGVNTDPIKLLTWENPPPAGSYFEGEEANYQQHYKELWGVK
jgi:ribose transport system substrate-binding protein